MTRRGRSRVGRSAWRRARCNPLALRVRQARIGERAVYIGNAAQTLHPVAGQGLNLGLRDAWDLAQIMRDAPDPGDAATLRTLRGAPATRCRRDDPRHRPSRRGFSRRQSVRRRRARRGADGARYFSRAAALLRAPHDLRSFRIAVKTNKIRSPSHRKNSAMRIGAHALAQRLVRRSDGRDHRPAFPPPGAALRRRARRFRDGFRPPRAARIAQDAAAPGPRGRARPGARCRSPAPTRRCSPTRRASTSPAAPRSSTSTWAARRRRSATCTPAPRCSRTRRWWPASWRRSSPRSTCRSR